MLLVTHGKRCTRCAANGRPRFTPEGPCPLTTLKGSARKSTPSPIKTPANASKGPVKSQSRELAVPEQNEGFVKRESDHGVKLEVVKEVQREMGIAAKEEYEGGNVVTKMEANRVKVEAAAVFSPSGVEHYGDLYKSGNKQDLKVGGIDSSLVGGTDTAISGAAGMSAAPHTVRKLARRGVKQEPI